MDTYTSAKYWNSIYFDSKVICDAVMLWVYQPCSLVTQIVLCHSVQYVEVLPLYLLLYLGTMGSQSFYILISRCWHFDRVNRHSYISLSQNCFWYYRTPGLKKKKKKIYMFHGLELLVFFFVLCFAKSCALLRCVSFPLSNSCTYEFVKHISNLVNFT